MSYCRFSSDNFWSDVYVYEDVLGGWTTHVAGSRLRIRPIPEISLSGLPDFGGEWDREARTVKYKTRWHGFMAAVVLRAWMWSHALHMWSVRRWPRSGIGLPFDGETFHDPTPGDCADRLEHLSLLGYRVPRHAVEALRAESNCDVS